LVKFRPPDTVLASVTHRFAAYFLDIILLMCLATLAAEPAKSSYFFQASADYLAGIHNILHLTRSLGGIESIIYFLVFSFGYFSFEAFSGKSLGKLIMKIQMNSTMPDRMVLRAVERGIVKCFPPVVVIDALFGLHSKYRQKFSDSKLGYIVSEKNQTTGLKLLPLLTISLLVIYLPLVTQIVLVSVFRIDFAASLTPSPSLKEIFSPSYAQMSSIFYSNSSLDVIDYFFGGFSLLFLDLLEVFSNSYIDGLLMGSSLVTHPSFFLYGVAPQLVVEELAYSISIVAAFMIIKSVVDLLEDYFHASPLSSAYNDLYRNCIILGALVIVSLLVLYFAAYVETFWTSSLLSHYYYHTEFMVGI